MMVQHVGGVLAWGTHAGFALRHSPEVAATAAAVAATAAAPAAAAAPASRVAATTTAAASKSAASAITAAVCKARLTAAAAAVVVAADGRRAAGRHHRPSWVVHAVPRVQRRAFGREVHPDHIVMMMAAGWWTQYGSHSVIPKSVVPFTREIRTSASNGNTSRTGNWNSPRTAGMLTTMHCRRNTGHFCFFWTLTLPRCFLLSPT
jgi:hypothetical protein